VRCVSVSEMYALDAETVKNSGITPYDLMERAANGIFREAANLTGTKAVVKVLAGKGNNGGDAYAVARLFHINGYSTEIYAVYPPSTNEAKKNKKICDYYGIPIYDSDRFMSVGTPIVVDGVFGIGFTGKMDEKASRLFDAVNISGGVKIALDIPSGLNGDTGTRDEHAFRADVTLAVEFPKRGHYLGWGPELSGVVVTVPIGLASGGAGDGEVIDASSGKKFRAGPYDNKYTCGHVQIFGGSDQYPGAAALAAGSALYGGAGYVTVNTAASETASFPPEIIVKKGGFDVSDVSAEAGCVIAGPGMGRSGEAGAFMRSLLGTHRSSTVLIDADGLYFFNDCFKKGVNEIILTPHIGEFSRISGLDKSVITGDLIETGRRFAVENGVTLVLKSGCTAVFSKDGRYALTERPCRGLATLGTGDVLAGIIGAAASHGAIGSFEAAKAGVYLQNASARAIIASGKKVFAASDLVEMMKRI